MCSRRGATRTLTPWQDVLQLNAYSPALRDAAAETVIAIGDQCDGVRCDMAMLMTNEVFSRTWGDRAGAGREADYWPTLIGRCKQAHPDLLFIAEVYWDMEWSLQQQGFDLCYDKRLYDRLVHDPPESLLGHLQADASYQERLIRFIENHDEPRAAATFGAAQARAAAVVMSTLQGARLYHDGQLEGRRTRLPVQLGRGPDEPPDSDLRAFYGRLLRAIADARVAKRRLALVRTARGCSTTTILTASSLLGAGRARDARHLVVVNLSPRRRRGPRAPAVGRPRRTNLEPGRQAERGPLRALRRRTGQRGLSRRPRGLGIALARSRALSCASGTAPLGSSRDGHMLGRSVRGLTRAGGRRP